MFSPEEIRAMLDAANPTMRAMTLLGVNCGVGPSDLARLPITAVDLKSGWVDYPRPKTGVHRRCPLWKETVAAIKAYLKTRREHHDEAHEGRLFVTSFGEAYISESDICVTISAEFGRLVRRLGFHRCGLGIYTLRHVFETIGGDARDHVAVDHIMGHARGDMASVYRESISDDRRMVLGGAHGFVGSTRDKGKIQKDVKKSETLVGHARMVFGKNLTDEQAVQAYGEYLSNHTTRNRPLA